MTAKKSSTILELAFWFFAIILPIILTLLMYMSSETTTSTMSANILGIVVIIGIILGALTVFKKRIKAKRDNGFKVSAYLTTVLGSVPWLTGTILFTWFLWTIKGEIDMLATVMILICISEFVAFCLGLWQVHFDEKLKENPNA